MTIRRMRFGLLSLMLLGVLAFNAHIAQAHRVGLLRSVPTDQSVIATLPDRIVAQFSEEVDPVHSNFDVLDEQGNIVLQGMAQLDLNDLDHATLFMLSPALPKGAYSVRWHVTLLDGDASVGQFGFVVGSSGAGPHTVVNRCVESLAQPACHVVQTVDANSTVSAGNEIWITLTERLRHPVWILGVLILVGVGITGGGVVLKSRRG